MGARPWRRILPEPGRGPVELALHLVGEVEMRLEEPAHEAGHQQQVLAPVGKLLGRRLGLLEPRRDQPEVVGEIAVQAG
jgi:hypothetical protein